jgi:hypothetical protein
VPEVESVEWRGADLVNCSGQSAVRNGGVHGANMGLVLDACQTDCGRLWQQCGSTVASCVAETFDLTDLLGRLRNSVYRVISQTPA